MSAFFDLISLKIERGIAMDNAVIERLESSFNLIAPRAEELVDRFYTNLFANNPSLRSMFPANLADQKKKLLASLVLVIQNLRSTDKLVEPLKKLGARHAKYNAKIEHYPVVRDTLVSVMAEIAGEQWNEQLNKDWLGALDFVASVMIEGHKQEDASASRTAAA